jgi:hypothetical protein
LILMRHHCANLTLAKVGPVSAKPIPDWQDAAPAARNTANPYWRTRGFYGILESLVKNKPTTEPVKANMSAGFNLSGYLAFLCNSCNWQKWGEA